MNHTHSPLQHRSPSLLQAAGLGRKALAAFALTLAIAGTAQAQTYANVTVGGAFAPGVYGQISLGNYPAPPVWNAQPMVVGRPVYGAPVGTPVQAVPTTQERSLHGSPEQHLPGGHETHWTGLRHMPQRTQPEDCTRVHAWSSYVAVGQSSAVEPSAQQGRSFGWQSRPQWRSPSGQSLEPMEPVDPQQKAPVTPAGKTAWQPRSFTMQPVAWLVQ